MVRKKLIRTTNHEKGDQKGSVGWVPSRLVKSQLPKGVFEVVIPGIRIPIRIRGADVRKTKFSIDGKTFVIKPIGGKLKAVKVPQEKK